MPSSNNMENMENKDVVKDMDNKAVASDAVATEAVEKLTPARAGRVAIFLVICAAIVAVTSFFCIPRGNSEKDGIINHKAHQYLAEPENTIDVVMFGNSDVRCGFIPIEMWNEYGVTCQTVGINRENVFGAYEEFMTILKTQSPKLVIIETDMIFASNNNRGVKPYENLVKVILERYIPVAKYHNRWKGLIKDGVPWDRLIEWDYTYTCWEKGYHFSNTVVHNEVNNEPQRNRTIRKFNRMRLDDFREVCAENDMQILFIEIPTLTSWSEAKSKAITKYTDKYGINYIDLNQHIEEMGLDWDTDSRDNGDHLNYYGAKKTTEYLCKYIMENYELPNHKGDEKYKSWDDYYQEYLEYVEKEGTSGKTEEGEA